MRIIIEIDGAPVVATEMPAVAAASADKAMELEPPAELARAAKALGAESAGAAKYIQPAGSAEFRPATIADAALAVRGEREVDAGRAAVIPISKKPRQRPRKRGGKF